MTALTLQPNSSLAEVFYQVSHSGNLTRTERYGLMSAILETALSEEEKAAIDRLLHAARRGWVTILD